MKKFLHTPWSGIALLGFVMMGYGILRGEMGLALAKAIQICLECIGIG